MFRVKRDTYTLLQKTNKDVFKYFCTCKFFPLFSLSNIRPRPPLHPLRWSIWNRLGRKTMYCIFKIKLDWIFDHSWIALLKGAYWIIQRFVVHYQILNLYQYCDSNIELFSLASYKTIALPTIVTAIVVALTRSYPLLKAIAKSKGKIIALSRSVSLAIVGRAITVWEAIQKRSHEPIYKTYTKK